MHTVCEAPAVKRSTYIGLLVLAFAITAVGVGIIYLAFLPASATQAAVETVSYPIEILTDIVKPDSINVDFDGTPAALGVSNYPRIELGATRYTQDEQLIGKATSLLKGKTFKRWYGAAIYRAKKGQMNGGYYSTLELDAANGSRLCNVSYDPGYVDNEGPGVYISDGNVIYVMEGDQTAVVDFMDRCTEDAYEQTCEPDPQTARDRGSSRTWLFDDEITWTPSK